MPKPCKAEGVRGAGRAAPPRESTGRVSVCRLLRRPGKALGVCEPCRCPGFPRLRSLASSSSA